MVDQKLLNSSETPKAADATVVIHKPNAGEDVVIQAHEGMQFQPGFNPAEADLTVNNGDLVFTFKDGATVTLDNFAELKEIPNIIMPDGSIVAGNVIVAQLTAETGSVFNLETAAGGGANGGGGHNYSDDLGNVIDLLNGVPPLPPTFLVFSVPEVEDFNPGYNDPTGGDFEPGTFTAYLQGTAGGYEDWQPAQNVGDLTVYPMQVKIAFTPDDNEVVDTITIKEIPDGVRLFVGDQTGGFTEITLVNGSYTVTTAALGGQGIFMLPPGDTDTDIPFKVSLLVRDPDTNETIVLTKDVTAVIDAAADLPELAGSITVGAVTDAHYVSGTEGDAVSLNLNIDFNDHDGSEVHTVTMAGVPQEWTLVSDSGLGFVGATAVNNGDGTVTYSVTYSGDFNGVVTFNPNEWTSLGANATQETGNITVTAKAVETALSGGEITLENNTSQVSTTFRVNLSEDVPEIILISGPAALAEPDLLIPGADIDTNTITVDFFSDAPGSIALTTEGLAALNLTSHGETISYSVSSNGLVITAVDEGGNTVFTVTLDPNATINGTQQTFTYSFELIQPVDHPDTTKADITDIPVHFTATDSDGDHANGLLHLTITDDVPVLSNSTLSMDESDDIGHVFNGSVNADLGADGYGSVIGTGAFTSTDANLTSDGHPVTVTYANGVYTGTANGVTVFTLTLAASGTYTFVQAAAIDHDNTASNNENTAMTFGVRATDYDGDTTTAVITVNIRDDGPKLTVSSVTVDETDGFGAAATGSVTASYGVDGAGSLAGNGSFAATGSVTGGVLASEGHPVTVTFSNGVYTGTADGATVFTMTLQPGGQYSFVQYGALDHADGSNANDSMALRFGVTVTDGDGDAVSDFITVNVIDDAPVANDDFVKMNESDNSVSGNVIDGSGAIDPAVSADDVGNDTDGYITEVSYNGVVHTFAAEGQTDADGTYVEVQGEHGTLKMYTDGDYTYTLDGSVDDINGSSQKTEFGTASSTTAAAMQEAWSDAELYAFDFGTSWESGGKLDLSNADDTISYNANGIGVTGGKDYLTVPEQVNYDPRTDKTQAIAVNLGFESNDAVVTVSNHFLDEAQGEWGKWTAYDAEGNIVDSGTFSDANIEYGSSNNIGTFTIHADGEYQYVVFSALPYGGTDDSADVCNDSSDYFIRAISFKDEGEENPCETDKFTYKLSDADTDTDTANLVICIKDDVPFVPVPVEKTVDESFNPVVVSDTITVDFGADGMGSWALQEVVSSTGSQLNGALTSNGHPVTVDVAGDTLTGYADGKAVFTLTLDQAGKYTYTQLGVLDHADGTNPDDAIKLTFTYRVTDGDGDGVNGNIVINVKDDAPSIVGSSKSSDETNDINHVVLGSVAADFGNDGEGVIEGNNTFGASGSLTGGTLTSGGEAVTVTYENGTYTGTTASGTTVFTLVIGADGAYTFTQNQPLDHAQSSFVAYGTTPSDSISGRNDVIDLSFGVKVTDYDGDSASSTIKISVADDAPIANRDDRHMNETDTSISGNVITGLNADNGAAAADKVGEDTEGTITSLRIGNNVYDFATLGQTDANGKFVSVNTQYGTVKMYEDGDYTYTRNSTSISADKYDLIYYRLTDSDGDTAESKIYLNIKNVSDLCPVDVSETVDETFITDTVSDTINVTGATTYALGTLAGGIGFGSEGSQAGGVLTSNGVPVTVAQNGNVITGTAGGETVFTLSLAANGSYTFNLTGNLDHADGTDPNDIINLKFTYTARDTYNQTVEGKITVNVKDDAPTVTGSCKSIDETVDIGRTVIGSVTEDFGNDGAGSVEGNNTFAASGSLAGGTLTSEGHAVTVSYANGVYTGTADGHTVFTMTIGTDGSYAFKQLAAIDHAQTSFVSYGTTPSDSIPGRNDVINLSFGVKATDYDGDSASSTIKIYIADDAPIANYDKRHINEHDTTPLTGNVITGLSADNGAAAADKVGQDVDGTITSLRINNTVYDFATYGHTDANGTYVTVNTTYGTLKMYSDGDYTYQLNGTPISSDKTELLFYRLTDADGDTAESKIYLTIKDANHSPCIEVEGGAGYVSTSFFNMDDDAIPFPMLKEGEELSDRGISLTDIAHMVNTAENLDINFPTTLTITYVESDHFVAGYDNVFGVYIMQDDGTIVNPELLWGSMSSNDTNPLADGTQFTYQIPEGITGKAGFFIIGDGFDLMEQLGAVNADGSPTGNGDLKFVANTSGGYDLYYVTTGGVSTLITQNVYHSLDQVNINSDGQTHAIAGLTESGARDVAMIGFEDLKGGSSTSDRDFNDVMFTVTINPIGDVNLVTGPLLTGFDISDSDSSRMSEVKVDVTDALSRDGVYFDFDGSDYSLVGSNLYHNGSDTGIDASIVKDASGIHVLLTGLGVTADYEAAVSHLKFESAADPMSAIGVRHVSVDVTDDFGNTSTVNTTYNIAGPVASDHIFIADDTHHNITGTAGQDMFVGTSGDDTFIGAQGNDLFFAGSGNDTLTGGQGQDHFVFQHGATGTDTITDYSSADGDTLNVADLLTDSHYIAGTSDVHDFVKVEASTGNVFVDTTGTGSFASGAAIAHLNGISTISTVNFILDNDEGAVKINPVV